MLNGFGAGAGPSPRIDGAGGTDCAESTAVVSAAATTRATRYRRQRVLIGRVSSYTRDSIRTTLSPHEMRCEKRWRSYHRRTSNVSGAGIASPTDVATRKRCPSGHGLYG